MSSPPRGAAPGAGPGAAPRPVPTTLGAPNEVSQRSEKDVMTVLGMIRKEFNVDDKRIYLMGHSMGGAGALYLGVARRSGWESATIRMEIGERSEPIMPRLFVARKVYFSG